MQKSVQSHTHTGRSTLEDFSFVALLVSVLGTLLVYLPFESVPFYTTKVSLFALFLAFAGLLYALSRIARGSLVFPPLFLPLLFTPLIVAYGVSSFFSSAPLALTFFGTSIDQSATLFVLLLVALLLLTALIVRKPQQFITCVVFFTGALTLTLIAQAGIVIFANLGFLSLPAYSNIIGTFSDFSHIAGLTLLLALVSLRFWVHDAKQTLFLYFLIVLSALLLLLTNMTFTWTLVLIGAALLLCESGYSLVKKNSIEMSEPRSTPKIIAPLLIVALACFALYFALGPVTRIAQMAGTDVVDVRPNVEATLLIGRHTFASSPLLGTGPNTFRNQWLLHHDREINEELYWGIDFEYGSGYLPTAFVTTGIVGILAWCIPLLFFIFFGLRSLRGGYIKEKRVRYLFLLSFAGSVYAFILMLGSTVGPVLLVLGFFLAGVCLSLYRYVYEHGEQTFVFSHKPRLGFFSVFLLTIAFLVCAYSAYLFTVRYVAHQQFEYAQSLLAQGESARAKKPLMTSLSFHESDRTYRALSMVELAELSRITSNTSLDAEEARTRFSTTLTSAIEFAQSALTLDPREYQNWLALAQVYRTITPLQVEGAYGYGLDAYKEALVHNPQSPSIRLAMAEHAFGANRLQEAETYLTEALTYKSNYVEAVLLLAKIKVLTGRASEALEAAQRAADFSENDSVALLSVGVLRFSLGSYTEARVAFEKALIVSPEYANARYFLAITYATLGLLEEAVRELETIAAQSVENSAQVASDIALLKQGTNPYTSARLIELGLSPTVEAPAE